MKEVEWSPSVCVCMCVCVQCAPLRQRNAAQLFHCQKREFLGGIVGLNWSDLRGFVWLIIQSSQTTAAASLWEPCQAERQVTQRLSALTRCAASTAEVSVCPLHVTEARATFFVLVWFRKTKGEYHGLGYSTFQFDLESGTLDKQCV